MILNNFNPLKTAVVLILLSPLLSLAQSKEARIDTIRSDSSNHKIVKTYNQEHQLVEESFLDEYGFALERTKEFDYYETGELMEEYWVLGKFTWIFYTTRLNGVYKEYHKNGKLKTIVTYKDGKVQGNLKAYYENGRLRCDCDFEDNLPSGIHKISHPNGQPWIKKIYKNGKLWNVTYNYDSAGNEMDKGTLLDGNGILNLYSKDGKLMEQEIYKNGKKKKTIVL